MRSNGEEGEKQHSWRKEKKKGGELLSPVKRKSTHEKKFRALARRGSAEEGEGESRLRGGEKGGLPREEKGGGKSFSQHKKGKGMGKNPEEEKRKSISFRTKKKGEQFFLI